MLPNFIHYRYYYVNVYFMSRVECDVEPISVIPGWDAANRMLESSVNKFAAACPTRPVWKCLKINYKKWLIKQSLDCVATMDI